MEDNMAEKRKTYICNVNDTDASTVFDILNFLF